MYFYFIFIFFSFCRGKSTHVCRGGLSKNDDSLLRLNATRCIKYIMDRTCPTTYLQCYVAIFYQNCGSFFSFVFFFFFFTFDFKTEINQEERDPSNWLFIICGASIYRLTFNLCTMLHYYIPRGNSLSRYNIIDIIM